VRLRPRHPVLFVVALVVASVLWYGPARRTREEMSVRGVKVPLTLVNVPRDLVITSNVPETVSVQLQGPLSRTLDPTSPLEVLLDLGNARPGIFDFPINTADMQLPPDVSVVSVDPPAVMVELERLRRTSLPVKPTVEGTPAPGFEVTEVRVAPPRLTVQGPSSLVGALEEIETTPVSIDGATGAVEAAVQPRLPHPLLRSLTAVPLLVVVEISPIPTPIPTPTATPRRRSR
jgi:YbbR domain-containing protein